ncbi:MAG: ABC transporter ATP-binding protein [Sphaerochaetaceae bacterium]
MKIRVDLLDLIHKLRAILTRKQKQKSISLLFLFIFMSLFQVVGVTAIFPFMNMVVDPTLVESQKILNFLYTSLNFSSRNAFILFLGIGLFVLIVSSNILQAFTVWMRTKFVMGLNHELSTYLLKVYLSKDYPFFLNRNTSTLGKNLLAEVYQLTNGLLMPLFDMAVSALVVITLVIVLLVSDFVSASIVLFVLGGFYLFINFKVRRKVKQMGQIRLEANKGRYKITGESLSGIKTTKVFGREKFFMDHFGVFSNKFTRTEVNMRTINQVPRYLLDALAFGSIVLLVVFLTISTGDAAKVIPIVSLFAFAGYRLLPAMQELFSSVTQIYFNQAILDSLYHDLSQDRSAEFGKNDYEPMEFNSEIELKNISFSYPETTITVLKNLSVTIKKNSTVAFVGSTGSGKTTLIDILLALLEPQEGNLIVDGNTITKENKRSWQKAIGYVPQDIFLSDDTVLRNIAFGVSDDKIDYDKVVRSAKIAALDTFITTQMENGYETLIGERGIRLSGGQRQRIGLARALYDNPPLLVLDEATSSLDGVTETAVMDAIKSASVDRTVIMIAHRLTTVKEADCIYFMEKGNIVDSGTYDELIKRNATFRDMAKQ